MEAILNSMMAAIIEFDENRLEEIYNEALSLHSISEVTVKLLTPLLIELGLRWESDEGSVAEEHFFSFYLRNKMGARYHPPPPGSTRAPVATGGAALRASRNWSAAVRPRRK